MRALEAVARTQTRSSARAAGFALDGQHVLSQEVDVAIVAIDPSHRGHAAAWHVEKDVPEGLRSGIGGVVRVERAVRGGRQGVVHEPELGKQIVAVLEVTLLAQGPLGFFGVGGEEVEQRLGDHSGWAPSLRMSR